jgi:hypothetical protein
MIEAFGAARVGDWVYCIGGLGSTLAPDGERRVNQVARYSIPEGRWELVDAQPSPAAKTDRSAPPFPQPRCRHAVCAIGPLIFIHGGEGALFNSRPKRAEDGGASPTRKIMSPHPLDTELSLEGGSPPRLEGSRLRAIQRTMYGDLWVFDARDHTWREIRPVHPPEGEEDDDEDDEDRPASSAAPKGSETGIHSSDDHVSAEERKKRFGYTKLSKSNPVRVDADKPARVTGADGAFRKAVKLPGVHGSTAGTRPLRVSKRLARSETQGSKPLDIPSSRESAEVPSSRHEADPPLRALRPGQSLKPPAPQARRGHCLCLWSDGSGCPWLVLYGGASMGVKGSNCPLTDVWAYSIAGGFWKLLRPRMPMYEGRAALDSVWVSPEEVSQAAAAREAGVPSEVLVPPPRSSGGGVVMGDALYVFGGASPRGALNDLWKFDLTAQIWRRIHPSLAVTDPSGETIAPSGHKAVIPPPRYGHFTVHDPWESECFLVWSGKGKHPTMQGSSPTRGGSIFSSSDLDESLLVDNVPWKYNTRTKQWSRAKLITDPYLQLSMARAAQREASRSAGFQENAAIAFMINKEHRKATKQARAEAERSLLETSKTLERHLSRAAFSAAHSRSQSEADGAPTVEAESEPSVLGAPMPRISGLFVPLFQNPQEKQLRGVWLELLRQAEEGATAAGPNARKFGNLIGEPPAPCFLTVPPSGLGGPFTTAEELESRVKDGQVFGASTAEVSIVKADASCRRIMVCGGLLSCSPGGLAPLQQVFHLLVPRPPDKDWKKHLKVDGVSASVLLRDEDGSERDGDEEDEVKSDGEGGVSVATSDANLPAYLRGILPRSKRKELEQPPELHVVGLGQTRVGALLNSDAGVRFAESTTRQARSVSPNPQLFSSTVVGDEEDLAWDASVASFTLGNEQSVFMTENREAEWGSSLEPPVGKASSSLQDYLQPKLLRSVLSLHRGQDERGGADGVWRWNRSGEGEDISAKGPEPGSTLHSIALLSTKRPSDGELALAAAKSPIKVSTGALAPHWTSQSDDDFPRVRTPELKLPSVDERPKSVSLSPEVTVFDSSKQGHFSPKSHLSRQQSPPKRFAEEGSIVSRPPLHERNESGFSPTADMLAGRPATSHSRSGGDSRAASHTRYSSIESTATDVEDEEDAGGPETTQPIPFKASRQGPRAPTPETQAARVEAQKHSFNRPTEQHMMPEPHPGRGAGSPFRRVTPMEVAKQADSLARQGREDSEAVHRRMLELERALTPGTRDIVASRMTGVPLTRLTPAQRSREAERLAGFQRAARAVAPADDPLQALERGTNVERSGVRRRPESQEDRRSLSRSLLDSRGGESSISTPVLASASMTWSEVPDEHPESKLAPLNPAVAAAAKTPLQMLRQSVKPQDTRVSLARDKMITGRMRAQLLRSLQVAELSDPSLPGSLRTGQVREALTPAVYAMGGGTVNRNLNEANRRHEIRRSRQEARHDDDEDSAKDEGADSELEDDENAEVSLDTEVLNASMRLRQSKDPLLHTSGSMGVLESLGSGALGSSATRRVRRERHRLSVGEIPGRAPGTINALHRKPLPLATRDLGPRIPPSSALPASMVRKVRALYKEQTTIGSALTPDLSLRRKRGGEWDGKEGDVVIPDRGEIVPLFVPHADTRPGSTSHIPAFAVLDSFPANSARRQQALGGARGPTLREVEEQTTKEALARAKKGLRLKRGEGDSVVSSVFPDGSLSLDYRAVSEKEAVERRERVERELRQQSLSSSMWDKGADATLGNKRPPTPPEAPETGAGSADHMSALLTRGIATSSVTPDLRVLMKRAQQENRATIVELGRSLKEKEKRRVSRVVVDAGLDSATTSASSQRALPPSQNLGVSERRRQELHQWEQQRAQYGEVAPLFHEMERSKQQKEFGRVASRMLKHTEGSTRAAQVASVPTTSAVVSCRPGLVNGTGRQLKSRARAEPIMRTALNIPEESAIALSRTRRDVALKRALSDTGVSMEDEVGPSLRDASAVGGVAGPDGDAAANGAGFGSTGDLDVPTRIYVSGFDRPVMTPDLGRLKRSLGDRRQEARRAVRERKDELVRLSSPEQKAW